MAKRQQYNNADKFCAKWKKQDKRGKEVDLQKESILTITQILPGKTKLYKNKEVHLEAYINCEGNLEFKDCVIHYNGNGMSYGINLAEGACLSVSNSLVICKGVNETPFISGSENNKIRLEATVFRNCVSFLEAQECRDFHMTGCEVINGFDKFISLTMKKGSKGCCEIEENKIVLENMPDFYHDIKEQGHKAFSSRFLRRNYVLIGIDNDSDYKVKFHNNLILEHESFRKTGDGLCCFSCSNAEVTNCTFIGITTSIRAICVKGSHFVNCRGAINVNPSYCTEEAFIDNCIFENSTSVLLMGAEAGTTVTNCQFVSCYDYLISAEGGRDKWSVEFCQFINTRFTKQHMNFDEDNEDDIEEVYGCISMFINRADNHFRKCIFDGVDIKGRGYLFTVENWGKEEPYRDTLHIEDCTFRNCSTEREDDELIYGYVEYNTLFRSNQQKYSVDITNCKGMNSVNKEGYCTKKFTIRTTTASGEKIGSNLSIPL